MQTIAHAQRAPGSGRTAARTLVETWLERIAALDGEGSRVFVRVHEGAARASAEVTDGLSRLR